MIWFRSLFTASPSPYEKELSIANKENLEKEVYDSLKYNNLDRIPVIQRVISLEQLKKFCQVKDVEKMVQSEALLASKEVRQIEFQLGYIGRAYQEAYKTSQWVLKNFLFSVGGYVNAIFFKLYDRLHESLLSLSLFYLNSEISIFTYVKKLIKKLGKSRNALHSNVTEYVQELLRNTRFAGKAAPLGACISYGAELSIVGASLWLFYLFRQYNLELMEDLEDNEFVDLTEKARLGELPPTFSGTEYTDQLISHLSSTPFQNGVIVFLIGEPGVGKTQSVANLATKIASGDVPALKGKSIVSVNTSNISDDKNRIINEIFNDIKEQEDRLILFFDEAKALNGGEGEDSLLQLFKTKIQERNISVILSTTQKEFKKHIATDEAFVSRIRRVDFKEPDRPTVKLILQNIALKFGVEIDADALEKIIDLAANLPQYKSFFNPRKSINAFEDCIKHLYSKASSTHFQNNIKEKEDALTALTVECRDNKDKDPFWISTPLAEEKLQQIVNLREEIEKINRAKKDSYKKQAHANSLIERHRSLKNRSVQLVQYLSNATTEELEKEYLFNKFILAPQLSKVCEDLKIPYKIDVPLVEERLKG